MTTTTKKARPNKKAGKKQNTSSAKNSKTLDMPPSAGITVVDGREFVIMPLKDFEEWQDEKMFAALVRERIEGGEPVVPFEDIVAQLAKMAP